MTAPPSRAGGFFVKLRKAVNSHPKRYGGRYLTGFNGKSYPKPRVRRRKKR